MASKRTKVAAESDLPENGSRVIVVVEGREICVFRHNDEYYGVLNFCIHQSGPLCEGVLDGNITIDENWEWTYDDEEKYISCPWHGWTFDITTGVSVKDERYRVPTFEVEAEDGDLFVRL